MKSVLEVIQATTAYFEKHEVESPRLNIEHLLGHVLGLKRMELYLQFERPIGNTELDKLRDLVKRRAAGEPLQHLLGTVEFLQHTFISDARALVPRPETEQLCAELIAARKAAPFTGRVLDVGTGSGVIALSLAAAWPEAQVEAVDLHPAALALAQENAARLGLTERVAFRQGDLLEGATGEYALIVANLPYIPAGEIAGLSREVQFDPLSALNGGADGLDLVRRLIAQSTKFLRGELALEIGQGQSDAVCDELREYNFHDIRPGADYQGVARFVLASYG